MFNNTDEFKRLITMVAGRDVNSLIVTGKAGSGKSTTIINTLKENFLVEGQDYNIVKGYTTVKSLYQSLYNYNNTIIVYDDCDSVFKHPDGINILKSALDSSTPRYISWMSSTNTFNDDNMDYFDIKYQIDIKNKYPNKFQFLGSIVFISNLSITEFDEAIKSRSICIDISPTYKEFIFGLANNIKYICADVDIKLKAEVLFYYINNQDKVDVDKFNLRTFVHAVAFRQAHPNNWIDMLKYA